MMKLRCAAALLLAGLLWWSGGMAEERAFTGYTIRDSQTKKMADGVTYYLYELLPEDGNAQRGQRIHLIEVEKKAIGRVRPVALPSGVRIHKSLKTPLTILKNAEQTVRGTILAGVNGDFFDIRAGGSVGHLKTDGEWRIAGEFPEGWAVGVAADGTPFIGQVREKITLTMPDGTEVPVNALNGLRGDTSRLDISPENVRVARKDNQLVLYTPDFWKATDTPNGGTEAVIVPDGALTGGTITARVERVNRRHKKGGTTLSKGRMILSGTGEGATLLRQLKAGDSVTLTLTVEPPFDSAVSVLGGGRPDGGPLLMLEGEPTDLGPFKAISEDVDYFYYRHHARTVFGLREDGGYFILALDGYKPDYFGMTLDEVQTLLCDLDAYTAVNLDGGSSTAMVLRISDRLRLITDFAATNRQIPVGSALALILQ